jgi:ketosteroid isomerase-like protein
MILPKPIDAYFAAQDGAALAAVFAAEADVLDEGQTHRGPEDIRAWWQAAKEKYHHSAAPLDMIEHDGKIVVRALVSGDFPGSPLVLRFTFGLEGALIRDLRINA